MSFKFQVDVRCVFEQQETEELDGRCLPYVSSKILIFKIYPFSKNARMIPGFRYDRRDALCFPALRPCPEKDGGLCPTYGESLNFNCN